MSTIKLLILSALGLTSASGEGFTDAHVTFYGQVRQVGGANTQLLQSGELEMSIGNQNNSANQISLKTRLHPVGAGPVKPYSYSLKVPLAYLPEANRSSEFLSISAQAADFRIEAITIDGTTATLPDGSSEFFALSFANRADQIRLDLIVQGDSTDTDGDTLPDWWENLHGLDPDVADANTDADSDGWSNLEEFRRGTNPTESNLKPTLATTELHIPELGTAGCYLRINDSDTPPTAITIQLDPDSLNGFALNGNAPTLADIQSGQLSITHTDQSIREASLPITWSDGGEIKSGAIRLIASTPSTSEGNDASLWLDAANLPAGDLASWPDRSGNDRHASQPLKAHQPAVGQFGQHYSVEFTSASSHLFFNETAIPAGDHTILAVWQSPGTRHSPQTLFASNNGFLRLDPTAEAVSYPGAPVYQTTGSAVRGFDSTLGKTTTSIFRHHGDELQNVYGLNFNGEEIQPESLAPLLPTIGARRQASAAAEPISEAFRGHLLELLVFPTSLAEQKLRDVHDYLQSKWNSTIVWDFSTELRPVTLDATGIVRGGHGNDNLSGTLVSGGPGDDILRAASGQQTFVFGAVDTGHDTIIDFDLEADIIDLSAHFWGESGDARQFISTRFETNFSTAIPTLDTVLILNSINQEIVLRDTIIGAPELAALIVEGRIRMGRLTVPTDVSLALAAGSEDSAPLLESLDQSFTIKISRNGDGTAGALEVPLGMLQDAIGGDFILEGAHDADGNRAVVKFGRGETSKLVTFHPIPDLETEGRERWETAILPHFRYAISGSSVARSIEDKPLAWITVTEPNALTSGQPARVEISRDGAIDTPLTVQLDLDGTAIEGTHIHQIPRTITIPAGQASLEIPITTVSSWDGAVARLVALRLIATENYMVGNPHEAIVYASANEIDTAESGFDHWLSAASNGAITSYLDLIKTEGAARVSEYMQAYAHGQTAPGLKINLVNGRPELSAKIASTAPDLRWQVQSADSLDSWSDVSATFSETLTTDHLRLLGPPIGSDTQQFFRLAFSIENGSRLDDAIASIAPATRHGIDGESTWRSDENGNLATRASDSGISRLIVEVDAPTQLNFLMSIADGDGNGRFTFYIDGERIAETSGSATRVARRLDPSKSVLLMWEFEADTGSATIKNTP